MLLVNLIELAQLFCFLMVGLSANPIHSVLFLILSFLASSISIIVNNGNIFIGIIIIIVYIGAVSILFLFSVLLLDLRSTALYTTRKYVILTFFVTIIILFSEIAYLLNDALDYTPLQDSTKIYFDWNSLYHSFHETEIFGLLLYNDYFFGIVLIALTLFIALIGAIIISLSGSSRLRRQIVNQQLSRNSSTFLRSNITTFSNKRTFCTNNLENANKKLSPEELEAVLYFDETLRIAKPSLEVLENLKKMPIENENKNFDYYGYDILSLFHLQVYACMRDYDVDPTEMNTYLIAKFEKGRVLRKTRTRIDKNIRTFNQNF